MTLARFALPTFGLAFALGAHALTRFAPWPPLAAFVAPAIATALLPFLVFAALHRAEAVARRLGEPFGTLLLTLSVTCIEVALIVSMMLNGDNNPALARESVFSTVMIVSTGLLGACMAIGAWKHREQDLRRQGANSYLGVLIATSVLTLILPDFTLTSPPGTFSKSQLALVSCLSLALYGAFLFSQTILHREHFLDRRAMPTQAQPHGGVRGGWSDGVLLVMSLLAIVILAEHVASLVEGALERLQVAQVDAIIGAMIASLVLTPEGLTALRAASGNELQRSLNVALGSALATIGLTFPAVGVVSLMTGRGLVIGLDHGDMVLLMLALAVCVVSFGTGRTNLLTGLVHLVLFATYVFLIFVP